MEAEIRSAGGVDFQLLGIGINGHVCFIEPSESLPAACYVTPIAEVNRRLYAPDFGGDVSNVPRTAITYGVKTLLSAREICLVAVGKGKAGVMEQALCGRVSTLLPASLLQLHNSTTVVLDADAAALVLLRRTELEASGARFVFYADDAFVA